MAAHPQTADAKPPAATQRRIQDHPLVAWLIENVSIVALCVVRMRVVPVPPRNSLVRHALCNIAGGLLQTEGSILVQYLLVTRVYKHVPYFQKDEAKLPSSYTRWPLALKDWLQCNGATYLSLGFFTAWLNMRLPEKDWNAVLATPFSPWSFLQKFLVVRVVVDVLFYVVHRALHSRLLFGPIHKRHHQHYRTALTTNFHFTPADLILEAFVPVLGGLFAVSALGFRHCRMDHSLLSAYINWYEIGSHSGKPVPTVSYFPPLRPLYQWLLGDVDARNVEFHERHHNKMHQNYGITQWVDWVMGTRKLQPQQMIDGDGEPPEVDEE